jgi:hypothetical protein
VLQPYFVCATESFCQISLRELRAFSVAGGENKTEGEWILGRMMNRAFSSICIRKLFTTTFSAIGNYLRFASGDEAGWRESMLEFATENPAEQF